MHDGRKALVCIRRQKLGELFHANIYERAVLWLASAQRLLNQNSLRFNALQGVVDMSISQLLIFSPKELSCYHTQVNMQVAVRLIIFLAILQTGK